MADAFIRAARQAETSQDLARLMEAVTAEMGFRHYALIHHADLRGAPAGRVDIKRYPDAIADRIIGEGLFRRDPVIRACTFAEGAFLWSELGQIIALDRHDRTCLEDGLRAGLNEGITVPCVLLGDCLGSCTFAGTARPDRATRYLGPAQMIGIFAFQAARRLTLGLRTPVARTSLHPRKRDCILLGGRGLSNKQIARALGITPRTVDGYMTEAREVFGVRGRVELAVSAVLAGEIGIEELR
ncbi:LuxR family transcriptional regulator [Sphingobium sp. 3R8]|uniref:helix-turn-helix transcriptional regulator n=1 Tax=Sphingobium sp. 3R8 TaxID=2874921 RepID=UPI001CC8F5F7|nr:autoinducer binding domain-containing protein [Sphingobium sp. 3R8]MBZ9650253.1 LuxR family transcriptional regulator [Sphingobium sp. 3R8]